MIAGILSLVSGLFSLAGKIFEWLYARDLVDAGKVQEKLENLSAQVKNAKIAVEAREAVRAASASGKLPKRDPFQRD